MSQYLSAEELRASLRAAVEAHRRHEPAGITLTATFAPRVHFAAYVLGVNLQAEVEKAARDVGYVVVTVRA